MKTLELKDLKHYLGTGLKVKIGEKIRELTAISLDSPFIFVTIHEGSRKKEMQNICNSKPIMIPLSALTEQLPDGSIPIVELAKIAEIHECDIEPHHISKNIMKIYAKWLINEKWIEFHYDIVHNSFLYFPSEGITFYHVDNQLQLFEYLYQNHFWLGDQSLFKTGEIIDKRSLR